VLHFLRNQVHLWICEVLDESPDLVICQNEHFHLLGHALQHLGVHGEGPAGSGEAIQMVVTGEQLVLGLLEMPICAELQLPGSAVNSVCGAFGHLDHQSYA
jgi:hypothetical protein